MSLHDFHFFAGRVGSRCHRCGGRFGLIRHQMLTLGGIVSFCSKRCNTEHRKQVRQEADKLKFHKWLLKDRSIHRSVN